MKKGKVILNLAMSLDGFIADENGGYNWIKGQGDNSLDHGPKYDHQLFLKDIDIIVMGRKSFNEEILKEYGNKEIYVASSKEGKKYPQVTWFRKNIVEAVVKARSAGKNIYLFGGGLLVDNFLKAQIIDEYIIGLIPMILGQGRPLFSGGFLPVPLKLDEFQLEDGIMILRYSKRQGDY